MQSNDLGRGEKREAMHHRTQGCSHITNGRLELKPKFWMVTRQRSSTGRLARIGKGASHWVVVLTKERSVLGETTIARHAATSSRL